MAGIYLIEKNGNLVELQERSYDSEARLQELLARYPSLLAGDQMETAEPRRWVLVAREMGLPSEEDGSDRWSVDHLFLDQDGVPTVVERTKPRMGRPRRITSAKEQAVISATLRKPKAATHWSARRLAKQVGLSPATVHRIWQKYGLQPHRVETFKFSCDPQFDAKLADIVGLYLDPPERALVLGLDFPISSRVSLIAS